MICLLIRSDQPTKLITYIRQCECEIIVRDENRIHSNMKVTEQIPRYKFDNIHKFHSKYVSKNLYRYCEFVF